MESDVLMEKNKFIVEEYLPDFKKEDIKININKEERILEISANKSSEEEEKAKSKGDVKIYYFEKKEDSFYKKVPIPENVSIEEVQTTFHKDGTLTIEFKK
ncbi:Hsp20 family protein [Candidatus Dependentiae bacterium]|nr:Hsp20 family protein [Candidatus Dependentiae bacterium]